MNEKQRARPESINHGATYVNGRLSIPSHPEIKAAGEERGSKEEWGGEEGGMEKK